MKKELSVSTPDGHRIAILFTPPYAANTTVILCHGLGGNRDEGSGLFIQLEKELGGRGFGIARFDFRGHGTSAFHSMDLTLSGEYLDLLEVVKCVRNSGGQRVAFVAASFAASAVAHVAAQEHENFQAVALWNPVIDYRYAFLEASTPWAKEILESREGDHLPPDAYARLPGKEFFLSKKLANEMAEDDTTKILTRLRMPVYICHGTSDSKVGIEPSRRLVIERESRALPTTFRELIGEDHGFRGHRQEVIQETVAWLNSLR